MFGRDVDPCRNRTPKSKFGKGPRWRTNNDGNESRNPRNDVKRPRRRYSVEEKRRLLDETAKPGESVFL